MEKKRKREIERERGQRRNSGGRKKSSHEWWAKSSAVTEAEFDGGREAEWMRRRRERERWSLERRDVLAE